MIFVTLCNPILSLLSTWMKIYGITWEDLIACFINALKTKDKLNFTAINYTLYYTLYHKLRISIQVISKFNIGVQSVTNIIV